ncbi:uncharacterized protein IUM83_02069 [Phytophthora cinnamomi]|uniref:uncharacterized protein n=1 Tax=Phytophthora cinnamomi TaxID=4785 RepID=UPI0035596358|nr:hypothetical protein IUM83_02069 [Phytophthora cinnamomi]
MSSSLGSREEKVGAKRKKTTNIKYFRRPFRREHYRKHHYNQHPNKWKQYQLLTEAECKTFFDDRSLHRSSMHLYLNKNQAPLVIEVDRAIVEGIIDSFLVGDDVDDISLDRIRSRLCCNVANTHYVLNIVNLNFYKRTSTTRQQRNKQIQATYAKSGNEPPDSELLRNPAFPLYLTSYLCPTLESREIVVVANDLDAIFIYGSAAKATATS